MNREDLKNLWFLWKAVYRQEKKTMCMVILSAILTAINSYILLVLLGYIIDVANRHAGQKKMMQIIIVTLLIKLLIEVILRWINERINKVLEEYPQEFATRELNRKALTFDYQHLEDPHVQDLRFRSFQRSFYGIGGWLMIVTQSMLKNIISMTIAVVIMIPMFRLNQIKIGYTIGIVSILLVLIMLNYVTGVNNTRKAMNTYFDASNLYNKKLFYLDLFSKIEPQKDIRVMRMENAVFLDINKLFRGVQESEKKQGELYVRRQLIQKTILNISTLLIYLYTSFCAWARLISIGQVVTYAASMSQMMDCANKLAVSFGHLKSAAMYAADYREFLTLQDAKYKGTIPVEKRRDCKFQVEFENVSFKYPGSEQYVIKNLNLKFVIGKKMAIVGKNGSGKSTFIKLLCRLYDVTEGCIKLNGIDIRKYDYKEYCDLFAVVFQDFSIFDFPMGENIAAASIYDKKRVKEAIDKVGLNTLEDKLTQGLDTIVGKECCSDGVNFSGGEKQKIAIARAIHKDAPFVIMDEPTAALDPEAEAEVFEGFDRMVGNKTAIYISHRLASCRFCDDILVFDEGAIVQHGNHEALLAEEGLYGKLWDAQARYYA